MQAAKQQQIMGYFIEEAKEHLDTIEQGLLDLQATMADTERLNELFRAAHSVKGGAAMLGLNSIQKVGHHLEDCFKLLKDHPVPIDRRLEDLFLKGFDALKELVDALQSPYGLREDEAEQMLQAVEPNFADLQNYLNQLTAGGTKTVGSAPVKPSAPQPPANLPAVLNGALKKMLELFKQGDRQECRQQLAAFCAKMTQLHNSSEWQELLKTVQAAIAVPKNSFQVLAPLVIKELKQASDLLVTGRAGEITPSRNLQQLALSTPPTPLPIKPQPVPIAPIATKVRQITIPGEPKAAAKALLEAFNKEELIELAEFLMKAIQ